ncbi:MAG: amino acid permease, partial [Myxococcota bacterium]
MGSESAGLRRDLGAFETYAAVVGILVGAGIFRVTGEAWALTGSSVILGYVVLAVPLVATSVPYAAFFSTSVGAGPGGEYSHIAAVFGGTSVAAWAAWMKTVSYVGALAFLAQALADYILTLAPGFAAQGTWIAELALTAFIAVHVAGVRWFGRAQALMFTILALSLVVLVVPGLAAVRTEHYAPFFKEGATGFAAALPPLF